MSQANKKILRTICQRLSLRAPQEVSLRMLDHVCKLMEQNASTESLLHAIEEVYPEVTSFDRSFPSLCFALATGVGKTRLMGAFIAYLYQAHNIRNFFIIAPNITVYRKLIADFTAGTPKYVFKGISLLEQKQPQIITGDNYESLQGVRGGMLDSMQERDVHINIFNIAKITAKDTKGSKLAKDDDKRKQPRIRRLSEYIGQSYFDYLASLPDLVVLMDESHRYRADAGLAAINELQPRLGLELTATPQVERGSKSEPFKNTIYNYRLAAAINDGFVKNPAVVTRRDFVSHNYSAEQIEIIKLEDGIHTHEDVRTSLNLYTASKDLPPMKPFVLVVAQDTEHANALQELMESQRFFEGRYKGKIITVHSKSTGKGEGDDIVEKLLTVEDPNNPVEIVIHVNMLKEGWDVTNLYTIVPLRAANSRTLVEQSIGRGLRLPFGRRTGVGAVDRLNIICHDKFQDIIDYANDPNSIIRTALYMGEDISTDRKQTVTVPSVLESLLIPKKDEDGEHGKPVDSVELDKLGKDDKDDEKSPEKIGTENENGKGIPSPSDTDRKISIIEAASEEAAPFLKTEAQRELAHQVYQSIQRYEHLKSSSELQKPEIQRRLVREIRAIMPPQQAILDPELTSEAIKDSIVDIEATVAMATKLYQNLHIDIPRITVVPKGDVQSWYEDFDLDCSSINKQPVAQEILIRYLQSGQEELIAGGTGIVYEKRPEDHIVKALICYDDIDYDGHADLLYKLAGQLVAHIRTYITDENDVNNVLLFHQYALGQFVHAQMQPHFMRSVTEYEARVSRGFQTLRANNYAMKADQHVEDLTTPIPEGQRNTMKSRAFGGFSRCLFPVVKFDSYPELLFARILERDPTVLKWVRPQANGFTIHITGNKSYSSDFVVETETTKYLCEPKRADLMDSPEVQDKASAARMWCQHASEHALTYGGKPWKYLLIPHDIIQENMRLTGFVREL